MAAAARTEVHTVVRNVLVVDDSAPFRDVVTSALRRAGLDAAGAPGGHTAWPLLESLRPDLVLLDLSMPVVNGRQFLRQLRTSATLSHTLVVLVSGRAAAGDPWQADRHVVGRLVKGQFGLSELVDRVKLAITSRELEGAATNSGDAAQGRTLTPPA
jgi:chemosensory pili system protein ChpA (sensor histidine kinase/response regulator)